MRSLTIFCKVLKNIICEASLFYLFLFMNCGVFGVNADEVKSVSVSVMEGDSVTLHTDVTHISDDDLILWMFGPRETSVAEIIKQSSKTFRDRLKLDNQTGSLSITHMRISDSGLYKLQIRINGEHTYKRFNVTVYAPLPVPVISRNSSQCSSSSERSSVCVLLCSVLNVSHVSLSWYKGSSLLSSISVSDLNIRLSLPVEVDYEDTNTYTCVLNNTITNHTQQLHINELCHKCSGWIFTFLVAFIPAALLFALAGVMLFLYMKHRRAGHKGFAPCGRREESVKTEDDVDYVHTTFCRHDEQTQKANVTEDVVYSSVVT